MILLNKIKTSNSHLLELKDNVNNTSALIDLNLGGSLQALVINGKQILANFKYKTYEETYASAILFPFVNRVNDGKYSFKGINYQLNCNEAANNNALHGLVYNKVFELKKYTISKKKTSVTIQYKEISKNSGFPFTYHILIKYTLSNKGIRIKARVKNTDTHSFPFTIGWHPYFYAKNFNNSSIQFQASQKVLHNSKMIGTKLTEFNSEMPLFFGGVSLDDCYDLAHNTILFKTSDYECKLQSSVANSFLQIYTPKTDNAIAIEPQTGISDSFNNGIGLQVLQPDQKYSVEWKLAIT
ncbi:aldose 1-epimerase [Polaribacter tangerinus]|uniref:aldose 1-epimerase n=1 Tax=Polaribacter tangerinus TaxID=1920034 RepID=UPI000B4A80F0|nr:aldose 1-epimerase [Polaribacter tangerinus]